MKKFFIVLGSVFLVLIVLVAIGIAFIAIKGTALDKESKVFHAFATLGRLQKCEPAQGHSLMSATTQSGKTTSGQYTAKATFEKGEATIKLGLIKHGDQWQILGFHVDSPVFVRR
jgi:hypothetical protein